MTVYWAANIVIAVGVTLIAIGMFGLLRYKRLAVRILIASKVDTVGFITVMIGAMMHAGFTGHSVKIFLIVIFTIVTNPLVTHAIAHSAHSSNHDLKRKETSDD